jgi:hypothetical protein
MITAYNRAVGVDVLRNGSDEAPPIRINGAYAGGNHPGVSNYVMEAIKVDGLVLPEATYVEGAALEVEEKYIVNGIATVRITRAFEASGLCRFVHVVFPHVPYKIGFHGGVQAQKPSVLPGEKLKLYVPGSTYSAGYDISLNAIEINVLKPTWAEPSVVPKSFYAVVESSTGVPRFGWAAIFDQSPQVSASSALFISQHTKLYPRSFDPDTGTLVEPGVDIITKGRFGTYEGGHAPH